MDGMDGTGIVMINMSFLLAVLDDLHLLLVTLVKLSSLGVDLQIQIQIQMKIQIQIQIQKIKFVIETTDEETRTASCEND